MAGNKRRVSVGVLFWIAFILLVLVIFLANRSNIEEVVQTTGILDVLKERFSRNSGAGETSVTVTPEESGETGEQLVAIEPEAGPAPAGSPSDPTDEPAPPVAVREQPSGQSDGSAEEGASGTSGRVADRPTTTSDPRRAPSADPTKPNKRLAALYYIRVTDDGRTYPQKVIRPVYYADSPLTETINALIAGPSGDELGLGLLNLIPPETRLLSAHVENGIAYLNFNQNFRFNSMGAEGTVAQLEQVIYASTEFANVRQVQFLIDGERVEYLGGEGIYVGEPLGRDAFS